MFTILDHFSSTGFHKFSTNQHWFFLVVAMSKDMFMSPLSMQFFSRPQIGLQITRSSVQGLSLVNPPALSPTYQTCFFSAMYSVDFPTCFFYNVLPYLFVYIVLCWLPNMFSWLVLWWCPNLFFSRLVLYWRPNFISCLVICWFPKKNYLPCRLLNS